MKSLIAVLALASALGVGYWKMQNPDGGLDEAKNQAQGLMNRLGGGVQAVRSGTSGAVTDTSAEINARFVELERSIKAGQSSVEDRLNAIERLASSTTGGDSSSGVTDANVAERFTSIDETLATAATLASDTESRMVMLEESVSSLQRSNSEATTQGASEVTARLEEQVSAMQATLDAQPEKSDSQLEEQLTAMQAALDAQAAKSAARIEALEAQLSEQSASAKLDIDTQLSSLRSENQSLAGSIDKTMDSHLERQGDTERTINLLNEKIASLTTRINTLSSVSSSNTDASNSAEDSTALASVTAQVDQRLAGIEERLSAATSANTRSTIDALQEKLEAANNRINGLESQLASTVDDSVSQLNSSVASVTKELNTVDASVSKLNTSVTSVSSEIDTVESEVGTLKSSYDTLQANIKTLESDLGELKSTVQSYAIEDLQNDLQTKLSNLENQVKNSPANDITSITAAIDQSRNRIKTLEQRVTDLPASSDESESAKKAQTALQNQIAALEARLSATSPASDEQLSNTINSVRQEVNDLKKRKYLTAEDLQRTTSGKSIEYKIYFEKSQIDISDEAAKVLDSFIAQEANRATSISIFGTTDRSGSDEYNQQLAKRRANRVRSYLIQRGYDFSKIGAVDGIGEDLAAAELPDGEEDPNQRSVIIYAYQP